MKKNIENHLRTCGCCHKELPVEDFYINKCTHKPDNYCKECRKSATSNRYRNRKLASKHTHPIITQVTDPALRMTLILHALQSVNESIARKQRKLHEEEAGGAFAG